MIRSVETVSATEPALKLLGLVTNELANRAANELASPTATSSAPPSAIRIPNHTIAASPKPGRTNKRRHITATVRTLNFPVREERVLSGLFEAAHTCGESLMVGFTVPAPFE
jgi:hypothetical protein